MNLALNNIDIDIQQKEFVAILGCNGSGKSTLAKHLNALLVPTSGTLWVKGMDSKDAKNVWNIRSIAGMVFQNPDNQLVATIVEEDVAFGPENLGIPPEEIRRRVDYALERVGMTQFAKSGPHLLSGGQKQRVAIAGILAMQPDCIILDEPTAMLDPIGRREVINTVLSLNKEFGITVILITHFMEEAAQADRIIVMDSGNIAMDGTPTAVFKNIEQLRALSLDIPPVAALADALQRNGTAVPENILTDEDFINYMQNRTIAANFEDFNQNYIPPENIVIELKQISHIYSPNTVFARTALDNINFSVHSGEFIGIIGHTGSGKSTLIQHLNALLKPTSGTVLLNGTDIHADKSKLKAIRQKVGLVFQYPEHQLFEVSVYKDVAFGPTNMGLSQEEIDNRVKAALDLVGITADLYEKSPFELSGGQKRRVAIAGVLAMQPDVLILDEPTAGLDPAGKNAILNQIAKMHNAVKNTVILVSHNMDDVSRLSDRIAVMDNGKIILTGTPQEVFSNPQLLESVGLSAPPIAILMDKLRKTGLKIPQGVFTVEAAAKILRG
ncbi:MAG: energy-coupling factor transporter ATPase [Firmicutes bacterium]|nr:energy-coupling factor transporter ATPase [Bacillota bacterium]